MIKKFYFSLFISDNIQIKELANNEKRKIANISNKYGKYKKKT